MARTVPELKEAARNMLANARAVDKANLWKLLIKNKVPKKEVEGLFAGIGYTGPAPKGGKKQRVAAEVKDVAKKAEIVAEGALKLAADAAEVLEEAEEAEEAAEVEEAEITRPKHRRLRRVAARAPELPKAAGNNLIVPADDGDYDKPLKSQRASKRRAALKIAVKQNKGDAKKATGLSTNKTEIETLPWGKDMRHVYKYSGTGPNGKEWHYYKYINEDSSAGARVGRTKHINYTKQEATANPRSGFELSVSDWMDIANRRFKKMNGIYKSGVAIPRHEKPTDPTELDKAGYVRRMFAKKSVLRRAKGNDVDENGYPIMERKALRETDMWSRPPITRDVEGRYQFMTRLFAIPDKAKESTDYNVHKRAIINLEQQIIAHIMTDNRVTRKHFNFDLDHLATSALVAGADKMFTTDCRRVPTSLAHKQSGKTSLTIPENLLVGYNIWKKLRNIGRSREIKNGYKIPKKYITVEGETVLNQESVDWSNRIDKYIEQIRKITGHEKGHNGMVRSMAMACDAAGKLLSKDEFTKMSKLYQFNARERRERTDANRLARKEGKQRVAAMKRGVVSNRNSAVAEYRKLVGNPNPFAGKENPVKAKAKRTRNRNMRVRVETEALVEKRNELARQITENNLGRGTGHKDIEAFVTRRRAGLSRSKARVNQDLNRLSKRLAKAGMKEVVLEKVVPAPKKSKKPSKGRRLSKKRFTSGPKQQPRPKRGRKSSRREAATLGEYSMNFY